MTRGVMTPLPPSPCGQHNGSFTLSFDCGSDAGVDQLLCWLEDCVVDVWHKWNGTVVQTTVQCCGIDDVYLFGRRVDPDTWKWQVNPTHNWMCAKEAIIHIQYL
jgi:hypothetical protein